MTDDDIDIDAAANARDAAEGEARRLRAEVLRLTAERDALKAAIATHHAQRADDRCWMDDNVLYAAAGLPEDTAHRCVGDRGAMLENCKRFIDLRCGEGKWETYAELEAGRDRLLEALTWAVGFIRCNFPGAWEQYEDMRNAAALAEAMPLWSGEFKRCSARAEVAEYERDELRAALAEVLRLKEAATRAYADACAALLWGYDPNTDAAGDLPRAVAALAEENARHESKWRDYESGYILPLFDFADRIGFDLRRLVRDNPGKNCAVLFAERFHQFVKAVEELRDKLAEYVQADAEPADGFSVAAREG